MKKIYIWGARRSGTNYLETLIQYNLKNPIANLNKNKPDYLIRGSKHDLDMELDKKFDFDNDINILLVKNPISWTYSRWKYENHCREVNPEHKAKYADSYIKEEWNDFYGTLRKFPFIVITYEQLSLNTESTIRNITDGVQSTECFRDLNNEVGPNRQIFFNKFKKPTNPELMYHDLLANETKITILNLLDKEVMKYYGYNENGLWNGK